MDAIAEDEEFLEGIFGDYIYIYTKNKSTRVRFAGSDFRQVSKSDIFIRRFSKTNPLKSNFRWLIFKNPY